ncbi:hypothetical protein NST41_07425 [Paenibacillus sp. FSL L8-0696]
MDEPDWFPAKTNFCPFLDINILNKEIIESENKTNIVECMKALIRDGYYLFMVLEQYYIPGSYGFGKYSYPHDVMLYGFNENEKVFYIADNLSGKYRFSKCSFSQFESAYFSLEKRKDRLDSKICLLRKKSNSHEKFDLLRVVDTLHGYWKSASPEIRSSNWSKSFSGCVKGLEVYNNLKEYIALLTHDEAIFDIRPFHALWEHKKIMVMRIQFMIDNGYIIKSDKILENYKMIEKKSLSHRNLFIKYNFTKDIAIINRIIEGIDEIVVLENELIPSLLNSICKSDNNINNKILGLEMNHNLRWSLS